MSMITKVLITTNFWVVGADKNLHARHQEEGDPHGGQEPQASNRKLTSAGSLEISAGSAAAGLKKNWFTHIFHKKDKHEEAHEAKKDKSDLNNECKAEPGKEATTFIGFKDSKRVFAQIVSHPAEWFVLAFEEHKECFVDQQTAWKIVLNNKSEHDNKKHAKDREASIVIWIGETEVRNAGKQAFGNHMKVKEYLKPTCKGNGVDSRKDREIHDDHNEHKMVTNAYDCEDGDAENTHKFFSKLCEAGPWHIALEAHPA